MGKGFFGGMIMGLIVSFGFLLIISSVSPLRSVTMTSEPAKPQAVPAVKGQTEPVVTQPAEITPPEEPRGTGVQSAVELPTGSGFGQSEPAHEITIEPAAEPVVAPEKAYEAPLANTESIAVPTVNDTVDGQSEGKAPSLVDAPGNTLMSEPALPSPAVPAPLAPPAPASPVTLPSVQAPEVTAPAPEVTKPMETDVDVTPEIEDPAPVEPDAMEQDQSAAPAVVEQPTVAINRLPAIGAKPEGVTETAQTPEPEAEVPFVRALEANSETVEISPEVPLVAVVLQDVGSGGVALPAWKDVRMPITFAVDPSQEGASELAKSYREAGYEVALVTAQLPVAGMSGDVEGAVAKYVADVPVSVALITDMGKAVPLPVMRQLVQAASSTGQGVVTSGKGLSRPDQLAEGTDVPVVSVSRVLDADGDDAAKQRLAMNKAMFDAAQNGSAVVFARTHPWTYVTLLEWALSGSTSSGVQAVPLSAVLKATDRN